jgi:hypothetical protein
MNKTDFNAASGLTSQEKTRTRLEWGAEAMRDGFEKLALSKLLVRFDRRRSRLRRSTLFVLSGRFAQEITHK